METSFTSLAGLTILVVEDEVMIAMMLQDMLEDLGCVVELVPSIDKALVVLGKGSLDGALLDMNIHGKKPIRVIEELVSRRVPFLLVTGYAPADGDPPVIKAAPRLQKPFAEDELRRRMAEVFAPATHARPQPKA